MAALEGRPPMQKANPEAAAHAGPLSGGGSRLKAIGLMCLAVTLFACLDSSAKFLQARSGLPTEQIVWLRFLGQLAAIVLALGLVSLPRLVRSSRPWLQGARSLLLLGSTAFNFAALIYLRLDQALTIQFLAPLLASLLAGPLLGDWIGWRRLLAILVGFCGILVAIRPGYAEVHPAVFLAFGCMLCYALFTLLTRYLSLSSSDPPETTLFLSLFAGAILYAPLALMSWQWPADTLTWVLLGLLGIFAGTGHFLFILAYRMAPVSSLSPFIYTQLAAATAIGYVVFGDLPDAWTLAGSGIVIISGLYLVHRERVRGASSPRTSPGS